MKISALAPWFGSKRTLAPRIVAELGQHRSYWEPFCGSMAVLMGKPVATVEQVNDLHGDLINLARVVQDETMAKDLYGRSYRTLFHEKLLSEAKAILMQPMGQGPDVTRAYWYLVFSWMSLNGVSGTPLNSTGTFAVRYSTSGGNGAGRWLSVVESLPEWHERLRGVQILNRCGFTLLERIEDKDGTVIYCDPPYLVKGAKYVHDFTADDHDRLAQMVQRFERTRVVVSYYDHPRLDELYPIWTKVTCNTAKAMVNGGRRGKGGRVDAPEVLLINGPSFTQPNDSGSLFGEGA